MLAVAALVALLTAATVALIVRRHGDDDFGPSVRDYAAFRAALAATERRRDQVHV